MIKIIVTDKILHGIVRENLSKFAVQLRGEGFVVRHDECWPVQLLNHVSRRKRFSASGDTQQSLEILAFFKVLDEFLDRLRLIPLRGHVAFELKIHAPSELLWSYDIQRNVDGRNTVRQCAHGDSFDAGFGVIGDILNVYAA